MFRTLVDPLISVLYPQECHVCGGPVESINNGVACEECWETTRIFEGGELLCDKCGALLTYSNESCRRCVDADFDRAIAAGIYENALAATVVQLKRIAYLPRRAQDAFENRLRDFFFSTDSIVIPVPLSKQRKFERGFNQADFLVRIVSRVTGFPIHSTSLVRTAHTPIPRTAMDKYEREMAVEKAFVVRAPRSIEGRNVILVDDVLTAGATSSACARMLKKSGATSVTVSTLARAVM